MSDKRRELERELAEEARLNGIGSEREARLLARIDELEKQLYRQEEALHKLRSWAEAYPLKVFPEPDFAKAHDALQTVGITLDAVSASNMRHVVTQVKKIIGAALPGDTINNIEVEEVDTNV